MRVHGGRLQPALFVALLMLSAPGVAVAQERPFSARLAGNASLTPTGDPCLLQNNETATGIATHLGRFSWDSEELADFCAQPGSVIVIGSFTMTAANGDQLFGVYTTLGVFDADGNLEIHGTFDFAGGSGRFAGATGGGDLDALGLLSPGLPVFGTFAGTIDYGGP